MRKRFKLVDTEIEYGSLEELNQTQITRMVIDGDHRFRVVFRLFCGSHLVETFVLPYPHYFLKEFEVFLDFVKNNRQAEITKIFETRFFDMNLTYDIKTENDPTIYLYQYGKDRERLREYLLFRTSLVEWQIMLDQFREALERNYYTERDHET